MPDHLHFFNMEPRIFSTQEFHNEMHEMILHILINSINEIVDIFKSHYPDKLIEEKNDDSFDESSVNSLISSKDDESEDSKEFKHAVNLFEFDKQIIIILMCLFARTNQIFEWASKEPEFIAFLNTKELTMNNLQICIGKDNQGVIYDFYATHTLLGNKITFSENAIKHVDIVDLFDLPGFPANLKKHIMHFGCIPNIVQKWRYKYHLNEHTLAVDPSLVISPSKQSPMKKPMNSPRKSKYVAVLIENCAQKIVSHSGALFAFPASLKGVPVTQTSPTKDTLAPRSPSCKRQIKYNEDDDREIKQARLQSSAV